MTLELFAIIFGCSLASFGIGAILARSFMVTELEDELAEAQDERDAASRRVEELSDEVADLEDRLAELDRPGAAL